MHTARSLAAGLVNEVLLRGRALTLVISELRTRHQSLDPRTLAAAQSLTYGVLRQAGRLRFFLMGLTQRPVQPEELVGYLMVGLHELDRQETPAYAAVNESVAAAGLAFPHSRGFVNAILRSFQRQRAELDRAAQQNPEARWNFPAWWLDRLRAEYPNTWQEIVTLQNTHPPMTLRVNRRRTTPAAYAKALAEAGIQSRQTGEWALTLASPVAVSELPDFTTGSVSVQDLGAQWAAPLLDAADGMRVLDACAAPGGKTGHLLELHDLDLTALDSDASRMTRVQENLDRLGLHATLKTADAGHPRRWWNNRLYQRILLDAPCTASGVVRRHPDGKWLKRAEDMQQLAREQVRLMDALWPLLESGGKMLYATCSLFRAENADQVAAFLKRHPDARVESLDLPGAQGGLLQPGLDSDGFFYARILKA